MTMSVLNNIEAAPQSTRCQHSTAGRNRPTHILAIHAWAECSDMRAHRQRGSQGKCKCKVGTHHRQSLDCLRNSAAAKIVKVVVEEELKTPKDPKKRTTPTNRRKPRKEREEDNERAIGNDRDRELRSRNAHGGPMRCFVVGQHLIIIATHLLPRSFPAHRSVADRPRCKICIGSSCTKARWQWRWQATVGGQEASAVTI